MTESLIFDKLLAKELINLLEEAKAEINSILPITLIGREKNFREIHSAILTIIYKIDKKPESIFVFCTEMFLKLLMGHKLIDGNKRLSLCFLITTLRNFGYRLYWFHL